MDHKCPSPLHCFENLVAFIPVLTLQKLIMKHFLFVFLSFCALEIFAQGQWKEMTSLPAGPRERAFHFTIGDQLYLGTGRGYPGGGFDGSINENDVWMYDFTTDTWHERRSFPGPAFRNGASFVIDSFAYVIAGHNGTDYIDQFWRYDPKTDTWAELPPFPGGPMSFPVAFNLGNKGYVTLGGIGADQPDRTFYNKTLWEYDPNTEGWSEKAAFPGEGRWRGFSFVIDGQAYVGGGDHENRNDIQNNGLDFSGCYKYDPGLDNWTAIADFPEGFSVGCFSFSINDKGYVGEGAQHQYFTDYRTKVWEYDPISDHWKHVSNLPGSQLGRIKGFSGTYQGRAYIGGGRHYAFAGLNAMYGDFYQWNIQGDPQIPDYSYWASLERSLIDSNQIEIHTVYGIDKDTIWALPAAPYTFSGSPLEVMFSDDGGMNWKGNTVDTTSGYTFNNLFAKNGHTAWVAASLNNGQTFIYQTDDGGESWTKKLDAAENIISEAIGIHFFDDDTGVFWGNDISLFQGGSLIFYRTVDGGNSWQQIKDPVLPLPGTGVSAFNLSGNNVYDAYHQSIWIISNTGVFYSKDKGETWQITAPGTFPSWAYSLAFEDENKRNVGCR